MAKNSWQPTASHEVLLERALMLKNIRAFFETRGIIEVETPLLSQYSTTDPHLDSLRSRFRDQSCYLNTSPEYAMKRLLADWKKPIYQVCKAFRDDELADLVTNLCQLSKCYAMDKVQFESLSYQQVFEDVVGINPHQTTAAECYQFAQSNNVEIPQGLGADDELNNWLDWLLTQLVLPAFNKNAFTFL